MSSRLPKKHQIQQLSSFRYITYSGMTQQIMMMITAWKLASRQNRSKDVNNCRWTPSSQMAELHHIRNKRHLFSPNCHFSLLLELHSSPWLMFTVLTFCGCCGRHVYMELERWAAVASLVDTNTRKQCILSCSLSWDTSVCRPSF